MDTDPIDPELARLVATHTSLFRGAMPAVSSHVPTGWYSVVDRLCVDLEEALRSEGRQLLEVRQIKEKFGTLRFHYRFPSDNEDFQANDEATGWVPVDAASPSDELRALLRALVDAASLASETICQQCGAAGTVRSVEGYLSALCSKHHEVARRAKPSASGTE